MHATNGTVIGKTMVIRGEVSGTEDLLLEGVVDGTITLEEGKLTVGPGGHAKANITVREIVIAGRVDGKVVARDRAELRGTAAFYGELTAAKMQVEGEAMMKASVDLTGGRTQKTPVPAKSPKSVQEHEVMAGVVAAEEAAVS